MVDKRDTERIAAVGNLLRPDWPIPSLIKLIQDKHAHRPGRDLLIAMTWIAYDPATKTPGRLAEDGPWWKAAAADMPASAQSGPRVDPVAVVLARAAGPGGCKHGEPRGSDHCPICRRTAGIQNQP